MPHPTRALLVFSLFAGCWSLACAAPPPSPDTQTGEPAPPTPDSLPAEQEPGDTPAPEVTIEILSGEECGGGKHTSANARVMTPGSNFDVPAIDFETQACCTPFEEKKAPPGITVWAAECEPWSCGGGCLRTTQVLVVPHEAPDLSQWFELSCNENLSAVPEGEVNDACDRLVVNASEAGFTDVHTASKSCPGEAGDEGYIESATITKSLVAFSPKGVERSEGESEPYKRDVWGCERD